VSPDRTAHDEVKARTAATEATMEPQPVPVNMWEATDALVVVAPFPAVAPDDVTVELREDRLRIWAHVRSSGPREYLVHEWQYGGFEREIVLPSGFGAGLEATLANGQLAVRVLRGDPVDQRVHPVPAGTHS
jgi:HSP20 family molecular chaperone IbpA